MLKKGNKLYSIFGKRCPKCHETKMFKGPVTQGIYNMHDKCAHCGQEYELETGFFWGAMYVGYGLSSAVMLGSFALGFWVFDFTLTQCYILAISLLLLSWPQIARLARSIWINIYVQYDKNAAARYQAALRQSEEKQAQIEYEEVDA